MLKFKSNSGAPLLPGWGGQRDEQGLKNASDVNDGALLCDEEVHGWEDEQTVQHQAHNHSDGIKAQLLSHGRRVVHLQDLTCNQEDYTKGEIPGEAKG